MEDFRALAKQFIEGGWIIPLIGAAAMLARLMSSDTKFSLLEQLKKIFSAAIASGIAWFILEQTDISSLYKAIAYGIIGVVSPEIINGLVKLGKRFQNNPEKFIKR
jgi:hypothetical protein